MIDWARVTELHDEVGAEDFEEVVDLFLEEAEGVINGLQTDMDATQMEERLHFLKGSALNLGFDTFSSLCADGERMAAAGSQNDIDLCAIKSIFAASRKAFLSGWKQKANA